MVGSSDRSADGALLASHNEGLGVGSVDGKSLLASHNEGLDVGSVDVERIFSVGVDEGEDVGNPHSGVG